MNARVSLAASFLGLALVACGGAAPEAEPSPSSSSGSPSPSATAPPTGSASPSGDATMRAPVYYLGGPEARPVLFREFRAVPRSEGVVRAAVEAMLHLAPEDTDYRSRWPRAARVLGVSTSGTSAIVDLSGSAREVTGTSAATERASLQQLVHTVTAAAPTVRTVRLRFDGATKPTLWGHVATTGDVGRDPQADTLAPVWVVEPGLGAPVGRTFQVTGVATVFEATVSWAVTRPGSATQLAHGFVSASQGAPGRGDYEVAVTLPEGTTGDVVFTAWESSAKDGSVTHADSKTYAVS
jgi:germination protein M